MFYVIRDSYFDYDYEIIGASRKYRNALKTMIKDVKRKGGGDIDVDTLAEAIDNGKDYENEDVQIWFDGAVVDSVGRWGISEWGGKNNEN